jgi:hypothetical protein
MIALSECVPTETWRSIVAKAVEQAVSGDAKARDWLAGYLLGKAHLSWATEQEAREWRRENGQMTVDDIVDSWG